MNALRMSAVIARVVAWHNRHPLARRIAPAHVQGVGVVALPFALPGDGRGDSGDPRTLTPLFGAEWTYGGDAATLGRWAARHGRYPLPEAAGWPQRQIDADLPRSHAADAAGLTGRTLRHVLTAVIEVDGLRVRVLVAPHAQRGGAAVFGTRLGSRARAAMVAAAGAATAAAFAALALRPALPPSAAPVLVAAADAAASGPPSSARAAASGQVASGAVAAAPLVFATASEARLTASAAPARPLDVDPVLRLRADGAPPLAWIRPQLTEDERRQARVQAAALRAPAAASAPAGPVFAIASAPLRTRDDALAQRALLQGLKAQVPTPAPTQLEVMAAQGRWRVVWFPHTVQREAERLLVEARARGLQVELIAF